jgi:hypothetical protein
MDMGKYDEDLNKDYCDLNCWYQLNGYFHAKCFHFDCGNNTGGYCSTAWREIPVLLCHKYDGKNNTKCFCG